MTEPTAVPPEWLTGLSTRARNALINLKVESRQDLIALSKLKLPRVRGCGATTKKELKLLLERVRLEPAEPPSPSDSCSPSGCDEGAVAVGNRPEASSGIPIAGPARWSILNKTAAELFAVNASPSFQESAGTLRLPPVDLQRLRARGIFPEDTAHLLCSFTMGYLLETGLSDQAISALLHTVARLSGLPGDALPTPAVTPADYSLYAGFPEGMLDPLIVPDFAFPALLDPADGPAEAVSWNAVAKITERSVLQTLGFSVTALGAIRYLWLLQGHAFSVAESVAAGISTDSYLDFNQLIDRYLHVTRSGRDQSPSDKKTLALEYRLSMDRLAPTDKKISLRKLADNFGITGESVRQVETKLLRRLNDETNLGHLDYLWRLLDRLMASGGGGRYISELCLSLQSMHGWSSPPSEETLAFIMGLSPRYRVATESSPLRVALSVPCCVGCETAVFAVAGALAASEHGALPVHQALDVMIGECQSLQCPELRKIASFSLSLVEFVTDQSPMLKVHDQALHLELPQQKSPLQDVLEGILLSAPDGVHFTEVQRRLKQILPGNSSSAHSIHSRLTSFRWAVLWGLGIFKHREQLSIPVSLISGILEDFASALERYDIPYLCANGGHYEGYADRLRAEGIPTSRAFYSCLKIVGNPKLSLEEFPYVQRKDHAGPRPSISQLLEQYIAKAHRAVTCWELKDFEVDRLGVPMPQAAYHRSRARNILKIGDLLLHIHNVQIVTDQLHRIVDEPPSPKEGTGPLKARLFRKHKKACESLGIIGANDLVRFVEHFLPGTVDWPHKHERRKVVSRKPQNQTVEISATAALPRRRTAPPADWVLSYLEDLAKPCLPMDIFSAFRAHPQQSDLYKRWLGNRETVLWYTHDTVIARKVLEWNDEKQYAIEAMALMHLEQRDAGGRPYGSCRELLLDGPGELPELSQGLTWTPVLLHSLLVSGANFLKIGRQKDFFVAKDNTCGIATLDDLLHHALLKDYGGVASKQALVAAYAKLGIKLSPTMPFLTGKDGRVVVDGDVIRAAGSEPAKSMTTEDTEEH
jgi:DNA-directed RNA polymerase, sigma subunit (sigma70/sigma32)